jgi:hypothetical protein
MNQLNYNPIGGFKLDADDLNFYHEAIKQGFSSVHKFIGDNLLLGAVQGDAALPGFDIALTWTEGCYWLDGEFYFIPAGGPIDLSSSGDDEVYLKLVDTFAPSGDELNKTGSPIQTYVVRQATLAVAPVGTASGETGFIALYDDVWARTWKTVALGSGYAHVSGDPLQIKREAFNRIRISGRFKLTGGSPTGGTINLLNYLAARYRPATIKRLAAVCETNATLAVFSVHPDGSIWITGTTGTTFATDNVYAIDWSYEI